jgi:hypothetical protein
MGLGMWCFEGAEFYYFLQSNSSIAVHKKNHIIKKVAISEISPEIPCEQVHV